MHETIDEFVEAFEVALAKRGLDRGRDVNLFDFLPEEDNPFHYEVAAELIRIDMEHSWSRGENKRLDSYQALLPKVFDSKQVLGDVAYEEYRLRAQAGEQVSAEQYHHQYGIPTDTWVRIDQVPPTRSPDANNGNRPSSVPELWQEALELVEEVPDFPGVGDSFLTFSLVEHLGKGAFSHVYLARQGELAERQVVLKIASGTSLEPQHLARLQHTNIVPIYSVHNERKLTAVCMPYLGRRTLADLLAVVHQEPEKLGSQQNLISTFLNRKDPTEKLPLAGEKTLERPGEEVPSKVLDAVANSSYVDAVIWLVKQLAEGLTHAHERGIIHRDLKPANVLLSDEGLPLLLDFNLSQEVVVNGRTTLLVGGTLPYMSPEQLRAVSRGEPLGCQTDLFSLGVIFFELLTGQRPYPDCDGPFDEVVSEMIAHRQNGCPSLRAQNAAIPRSIDAVVQRCLVADLQQRYQSAAELVDDLDRHLRNEPLVHAPDRSIREKTGKWLRRHPRLTSAGVVASMAACLVGLLLGLWVLRGSQLARLEAEEFLHARQQNHPTLELAIGLLHTDREVLRDAASETRNHLNDYRVLNDANWQSRRLYRSLSPQDQVSLNHSLAEELFLLVRANERLLAAEDEGKPYEGLLRDSLRLNRQAVDLFLPAMPPQALQDQQTRLRGLLGHDNASEQSRSDADRQPNENTIDQYDQVYRLITVGEYKQAEGLLTSYRDNNPKDPLAWLLLGNTKHALDKPYEAEGCYTTAIAFEPDSYLAYLQRGFSRLKRKQYDDARQDFERVIKLRPRLACGYLNRALAFRALRDYPAAIDDLTKAIDLGTPQTRAYFLRSDLRKLVGDAAGAAADRELGLELIPTDEQSWIARGYAKLSTNPEAALEDYRQALQLNPGSRAALLKIANVLADHLGKSDEALATIDQILETKGQDTDALASRAVLLARDNQRDTALNYVKKLLQTSKSPQALFQAACALSLTSRTVDADASKALTLLAQAVQAEPAWLMRALSDPDLKPLRETVAFQEFIANSRKVARMQVDLAEDPQE